MRSTLKFWLVCLASVGCTAMVAGIGFFGQGGWLTTLTFVIGPWVGGTVSAFFYGDEEQVANTGESNLMFLRYPSP